MQRSRIEKLIVIAVVVLVGIGLAVAGPARADDPSSGHSVVGSWRLMAGGAAGTPAGDPTLATFAPDGSLILSARAVRPALPGMPFKFIHFSTGHGAWEATDERSVAFTIVHLRTDETGNFRGTVTVSGTLEVADDGQTISGIETFTVRGPADEVMAAFPDALEGTRISVEPMAEVGTPPAS